jgi:Aspartyl protease
MKFRYKKIPSDVDPKGYTLHPVIQVSLRYKSNSFDLRALIDSGAADCIFHRSIGEALGIDVESGTAKDYTGIARQSVVGYVHEIGLRVQGMSEWVKIQAAFIDAQVIPLLGEEGFFDSFQVVFERYRGRFEVNSRARYRLRH